VDVHAHFVTPWYVESAVAGGHQHPDGMPGWPQWSIEDHLRLMDAHAIDQAVLSISSPGVHFGNDARAVSLARRVNEFAAQVCAQRPDRFRFFASVPLPAVDEAVAEVGRSLDELGAAGVVVQTNVGGRYLTDKAYEPFFSELDRREAVMFVHPTSPPAWEHTALGFPRPMIEFLIETTRTIVGLLLSGTLARHAAIRPVVPHCGAFLPLVLERLELFATALDAGLGDPAEIEELGKVVHRLWYDLAGTPMPTQADTLISKVGTGRLVYGSDYCWTPPAAVAKQLTALDSRWRSDAHGPWRQLAAANAASLLSRETVDVSR